jgi:uncharacterized protein YodC (DUF2158 family)
MAKHSVLTRKNWVQFPVDPVKKKEAKMEIKKDDFVRFKSGGPLMLVIEAYDSGSIYCNWFTMMGEAQDKCFKSDYLVKVEKIEASQEIKDVNSKFDLLMLGK